MSCKFYAEPDPTKELCAEVAAFAPANPFYAPAYIEARRLLGFQPWVFALRQGGHLVSACTAFAKSGYLGRSLEIASLPPLPDGDLFWEDLLRFCRQARVLNLTINSFVSPCATIPTLPNEIYRRTRYEYLLELRKPGLWDRLSSNHLRNIKRGRKAGLRVQRAANERACQKHAHLIGASMGRRKNRGEAVPKRVRIESFVAMTQTGAGEFFQAVLNGEVLSSILVLLAKRGGYYQSAGTTTEGMACGSSHFLVSEIAKSLQNQSMEVFNLGGTDHLNPGLVRFKAGFGTKTVQLEAAEFFLGSNARKKFTGVARSLRDKYLQFLQPVLDR